MQLTASQYDAIFDLVWNAGVSLFQKVGGKKLLDDINSYRFENVPDDIRAIPGARTRREAEAIMFAKGKYLRK